MIDQLGDRDKNRERLLEEGFNQIEISGKKTFNLPIHEIDGLIKNLRHFHKDREYRTLLVGSSEYEIYDRKYSGGQTQ